MMIMMKNQTLRLIKSGDTYAFSFRDYSFYNWLLLNSVNKKIVLKSNRTETPRLYRIYFATFSFYNYHIFMQCAVSNTEEEYCLVLLNIFPCFKFSK